MKVRHSILSSSPFIADVPNPWLAKFAHMKFAHINRPKHYRQLRLKVSGFDWLVGIYQSAYSVVLDGVPRNLRMPSPG